MVDIFNLTYLKHVFVLILFKVPDFKSCTLFSAFVTYHMRDSTFNAWTGLNDVNSEHTFLWTDGRGVHYTNWGKGYPGGRRSSLSYEDVSLIVTSCLHTISVCKESPC